MKTNYSVTVFMRLDKISKKKKDAPVVIQIYRDGQKTQKRVFRIKPEYWDEENCVVKKSHPNSMEKNYQLKQAVAECEELTFSIIKANNEFGINQIRNNIHQRTSLDFFEYANSYLEKLEKDGNISLYKKDKAIMNKFKIFFEKDCLPINKFSSGLIVKYEQYLLTEKGNCRNTVTTNMKRLSKYVRDIYKNYKLDMSQFPFNDYEMTTEKTQRCPLTAKEISRIANLKLTPINKLCDAREIFLMESYTGIRIGDILTLKWKIIINKDCLL
ncbi:site-specific integrase [Dysgonomonas sp. ZJ709]|uniref:site-specific integrase n=1 Tax=Dysgonomonas sp. ZJ709 TaxID=2709797 RepID=UPI0013EB649D|nr:site-specific integrase [Dysgonomonas sp. ZJ709]